MTYWNDIINILAIPSLIIGVIGIIYAQKQDKKAKVAEKKIEELQNAMISYEYLKKKGFDFYQNGKYNESLDAFKKFLYENNDQNEWNEVINYIFIKETEKIFSNILVFSAEKTPTFNILVYTLIAYEDSFLSIQYPEIVKVLVTDYNDKFPRQRFQAVFLISLLDKDWAKAKEYFEKFCLSGDFALDTDYKKFILSYLDAKISVDDIPF